MAGWLSKLLPIAGAVAAPFTGGASLGLLGAGGAALSGMAGGAASGRELENQQNISRDRNVVDSYSTKQAALNQILQMAEKASMDRANLGITAPSARTSQLIRGSLLQNMKPASITPTSSRVKIPQISGGLTPASLSAMARQGGGELQKQALMALMSKSDIPAQQDYKSALLASPELSQMKQPGKFESIAGILGPILTAAGSIKGTAKPGGGGFETGTAGMGNKMPMPLTGYNQAMVPNTAQLPGFPGWAPPDPLVARQNTALPPLQRPVARG